MLKLPQSSFAMASLVQGEEYHGLFRDTHSPLRREPAHSRHTSFATTGYFERQEPLREQMVGEPHQ